MPSSTIVPQFGFNFGFDEVPVYANLIRHSPGFEPTGGASTLALDQYGDPQADFLIRLRVLETVAGTTQGGNPGEVFALSFPGQASIFGGFCSITNQVYDSASNMTTAKVFVIYLAGLSPYLIFTNTRRNPATDTTNTGLVCRSMFMMRPIAPGATQWQATTEKFNRALPAVTAPFKGGWGRDLDTGYVNGMEILQPDGVTYYSPPATPANRTMPYFACQNRNTQVPHGFCLEDRIEFANLCGVGLWHCFPGPATPELWQLTLNIVKYGSDVTGTPYTGTAGSNPWPGGLVANAVHAPLAGRFFFEISNEVWNSGQGFTQYYWFQDKGNANLSTLNANGEVDGTGNLPGRGGLIPRFCQVAYDLTAVADLAKATFPGGLNVKYFPILSTQAGSATTASADSVLYLQRHLSARGETLAQNISGIGGAYYGVQTLDPRTANVTVDQVIAAGSRPTSGMAIDGVVAAQVGVPFAAYEGGLSSYIDGIGYAVTHDPRYEQQCLDWALNTVDCGGRYLTHFALIAGGWSLVDSITNTDTPNWRAYNKLLSYYPMDGRTAVARPTATAPTFADASFETARVDISGYAIAPTGSPWTFTGNAGINGPLTGFNNANQPPPAGTQVGFIQGAGSIAQTVSFPTAGNYIIGGQMNGRVGNVSGDGVDHSPPFDVLVDGVVVGTFTPIAKPVLWPYDGNSYQNYQPFATAPVALTAGSHAIAFRTTINQDLTILLDAVTITAAGAALVSIQVTPTSAMIPGGATQQFAAVGTYSDATTASLTGSSIIWTTTLGTVLGGLLTAPAATSAVQSGTVTAKVGSGSAAVSGSVGFTVPAGGMTPTNTPAPAAAVAYVLSLLRVG